MMPALAQALALRRPDRVAFRSKNDKHMPPLRISYQTIEFEHVDIHLRTLRDLQQFPDDTSAAEALGVPTASWPLFGVLWDSGRVLAQLMTEFDIAGRRILELGCGIGLASLVLNSRHADITATDFHPDAGVFLTENVKLNGGRPIPFVRAGWTEACPGLGRFDLILGSDLLYDADHIDLLSGFIDRHANPRCEVIIVDPDRGHQASFSERMQRLGFAASASRPPADAFLPPDYRGHILRYRR